MFEINRDTNGKPNRTPLNIQAEQANQLQLIAQALTRIDYSLSKISASVGPMVR